jgi:hypothetical protein
LEAFALGGFALGASTRVFGCAPAMRLNIANDDDCFMLFSHVRVSIVARP